MFRKDNIGNLLATTKSCLPCCLVSSSSRKKSSSSNEEEEEKDGDDDKKKRKRKIAPQLPPESSPPADKLYASEPPLKANAVVFNFSFTDDDEYFECARSATGGASLEDFNRVRIINVLNETEKDDLETRLFECGVPMKTLYDVSESVFEESRRRD